MSNDPTPDTPETPQALPVEPQDHARPETSDELPPPERPARAKRAFPWRKALIWAGGAVGGLVVLAGIGVAALDSAPGKRFIVSQITGLKPENGLKIGIGRIDGSIYGDFTVHDLSLSDPQGVFFKSPAVRLNWRPFGLINKHVDVRELSSPRVEWLRQPAFTDTPKTTPAEPFKLPDLRIDAEKVDLKAIYLAPAVTGEAQTLTLAGNAHLKNGRAVIDARLTGDRGDRAVLRLNAQPDANRFDLSAAVDAPKGGAITGLAKLDLPLTVRLDGKGDWKAWNGRLTGTAGDQPLADLNLTARDGLFGVKGTARPQAIIPSTADLFSPAVNIDLSTTFKDRVADGTLSLAADALTLDAKGRIDLGKGEFGDLNLNAVLLKPASIAKGLNGKDVVASLLLDGPFKRPLIDYKLSAASIGFNDVGVHQLRAEGRSRLDGDHILIPVKASAKHMTGLNAAAESLVSNITINGDLAWSDGLILSDNLKIRSDKINGTAIILAQPAEGRYEGALKGRINQYLVDGIGVFNLTIDADLRQLKAGGFGIVGKVDGQSVRIDNGGMKSFFGGNFKFSGAMNTTATGDVILQRLTLTAPDFRLTSASGRLSKGRLNFKLAAQSTRYGPLSAEAGGTINAPTLVLRAEKPGLGLGLEQVVARLSTTPQGYAVTAEGGSQYGPLKADVLVLKGAGPLTIDVRTAEVAGFSANGRVAQSDSGPFTGALTLTGRGVNGTVRLLAFDAVQGAQVSARANNTLLPGEAEIRIGRALIEATARLDDQPTIKGDVQLADVVYGENYVEKARARIDLKGMRGTVQMIANGDAGTAFNIAANAQVSPDDILVALSGRAGQVPFALERPARMVRQGDDWVLAPAGLMTAQGKVNLAGRFGEIIRAQAQFDRFDLSILNIIDPNLGVNGTVSGGLDYTQRGNAFPQAQMQLNFNNLTRTTIARVSTPLDIQMQASLSENRSEARGLLRQGGADIGRFNLNIDPRGEGVWIQQLQNGAVSGGLRFNGPSSVLFSLAGLGDQQMTGNVALAADLSGTLGQPRLNGLVRGNGLVYEHLTFGTRISDIALEGRFSNDRLELQKFEGRAGDGRVSATGFVGLSADENFPMKLNAKLENARLAASDALASTVSGTLDVTNDAQSGPWIRGNLNLPEFRYQVVFQGASKVDELEGVRVKGARIVERKSTNVAPTLWNLDIRLRADNQIFVSGMGLESEWRMNLNVAGTTRAPRVVGNLNALRGTYAFSGREFEIDKGVITFDGGTLTNPEIALTATTEVDEITGTINVSGRAQNPQIAFGSSPSLPQDEVLSRLLFGENVANLSATQALQLAASLQALQGGGGLNPLGKLRSVTGIDRLRVLGADASTGRGTAVAAGQYLTNDIYVEIVTDTRGFTATQIEIALSRVLSVLTQVGTTTGTSVNLRYSRDY
ncbi:translocation/assembly module TamB domain-containing protein [Asticcacaulis sp. AND118]|uniref:translocation/assembly module TamB domain-containing protein n=1 Tax=Asticcacaulis sp. AND118 TaxID=2840468 RepID=UPI001CFFA405|nr:translocation/assembly module TamB domain-containing protein [Asticcacaulis sp. AND118]UDF02848.1 translocation/assembly module TamB domain-containing protein [Asticcacaulis sp. AND118]